MGELTEATTNPRQLKGEGKIGTLAPQNLSGQNKGKKGGMTGQVCGLTKIHTRDNAENMSEQWEG